MSGLHYIDEEAIRGIVERAHPETSLPGHAQPSKLAGRAGNAARLESALAQPRWPHHRTAQQKAAALHYSLNKNHPFVDGNKRLAVAAMAWFLFSNGFLLFATNDQLVEFALSVANDRLSREDSARWIEQRALRTHVDSANALRALAQRRSRPPNTLRSGKGQRHRCPLQRAIARRASWRTVAQRTP